MNVGSAGEAIETANDDGLWEYAFTESYVPPLWIWRESLEEFVAETLVPFCRRIFLHTADLGSAAEPKAARDQVREVHPAERPDRPHTRGSSPAAGGCGPLVPRGAFE